MSRELGARGTEQESSQWSVLQWLAVSWECPVLQSFSPSVFQPSITTINIAQYLNDSTSQFIDNGSETAMFVINLVAL
jgi:hypothetical protein